MCTCMQYAYIIYDQLRNTYQWTTNNIATVGFHLLVYLLEVLHVEASVNIQGAK